MLKTKKQSSLLHSTETRGLRSNFWPIDTLHYVKWKPHSFFPLWMLWPMSTQIHKGKTQSWSKWKKNDFGFLFTKTLKTFSWRVAQILLWQATPSLNSFVRTYCWAQTLKVKELFVNLPIWKYLSFISIFRLKALMM